MAPGPPGIREPPGARAAGREDLAGLLLVKRAWGERFATAAPTSPALRRPAFWKTVVPGLPPLRGEQAERVTLAAQVPPAWWVRLEEIPPIHSTTSAAECAILRLVRERRAESVRRSPGDCHVTWKMV